MKAGPKAAPKGEPLPLHELPESGPARVSAFVETYCRVVKGGTNNPAGELIRLRDRHRHFLSALYNPRPRPRQALLSVARRNGKSLLGTPLALYHLLADGEEAAEVLLASSDQRTAEVIFRLARRMVGLDERMTGVCQLFQDRIYRPASDSVLEPLLRSSVRDQLALLLAEHPARAVTMAWREVDAPPVSVPLILTTRVKTALNRNYFNTFVWKVAPATAGVESSRTISTLSRRELTLYYAIWSPGPWPRDRHRRLVIAPAKEGLRPRRLRRQE